MRTTDDASGLMDGGQAIDELDLQRALANVSSDLLGDSGSMPQIGRFSLRDRIGTGGMGVVYSAFDPQLDRVVAIKLLHPETVDDAEQSGGHNLLLREARSLAKLRHPNVVTIHEVGTEGDRLFLAMEFVAGEPLDTWMTTPRPWPEVVAVLREAGQGLAAAHDAGIVHRDFKPSNVILGDDGRVTVIDFGLARAEANPDLADDSETDGALNDAPHTQRGAIVGTPAYMAPEQHLGQAANPASDQFAFCVSIYEALYGQLPFATNSRSQLLLDIEEGRRAPTPADRTAPPWLRRVILRGLLPSAEDRWPDMRALLSALDPMPRRRWRNRLALGATGVAAIVVTQQLGSETEPCADAQQHLEGAWDRDLAASLDTKFAANAAWPGVRTSLEGFAEQWMGYWIAACRATHVDGSQSAEALDKRMACLDHHRGQLAAFVQGLQHGDARVLARAAVQVEGLEAGEGCGDVQAMLGQVPPPSNPERRATFHRIIDNAQASSLEAQLLGNPAEALAELEQLHHEAVELDHPRALRFVTMAQGDALDELDKTAESVKAAEAAMRYAEAAGDDMAALELASTLVYLHSTRLLDPVKAEMWSTLAENKLARVGVVPIATLNGLRVNQAAALEMNAEFQAAVDLLTEVLAGLPAEGYERLRSTALHNRASAYRDLEELELASNDLLEATALRAALLGPDHRLTGESKLQLAYLLSQQGATAEADTHLAEAIEILRAAKGTARDLVAAQQTRAIFAAQRGDIDEAIDLLRPAIEDGIRVLGADAEDVTNMQYNLARMLMMADRADEAMVAARRSLDALERKYGPEYPPLSTDLGLIAEIQLQQGLPEAALETLDRALKLANTDLARTEFEAVSIVARLSMHCDVERAQAEAQAEIERLEALATTPGIVTAIGQLADQSKSWEKGPLPDACGAVAKVDSERPAGDDSEPG